MKNPRESSREKRSAPDPGSRAPKVLETFLRALEKLARLAPEVQALEEELSGREEGLLLRVLDLVKPVIPRLAVAIVHREPWLDGTTPSTSRGDRRAADDGIVLTRRFQQERGEDGSLGYHSVEVILVKGGRLIEIEQSATWREGDPTARGAVWRIGSREVAPDGAFAREHLRGALAALLDAFRLALRREHEKKGEIQERLALVEEATRVLDGKRPPRD